MLETLEERLTPSSYTVIDTSDNPDDTSSLFSANWNEDDPLIVDNTALVDPLSAPAANAADGGKAGRPDAGPSAGTGSNGNAPNLAGVYAGAGQGPGGASTPFAAGGGGSGGGGGSPAGGNLATLGIEGAFAAPTFAAVTANNVTSTPPTLPPTTATTPTSATAAAATNPTPQAPTDPVHAIFDLSTSTLAAADFPSDVFTVPDANNLTGVQVNLPLPYSANTTNTVEIQANEDTKVLNTLDGFSLQPRLSIPFDGAIDPTTVNSSDVFLISLGDTVPGGDKGGEVVAINQVLFDQTTNTLHVWANDLLNQHTRYALIVTNGVLDANGNPVQASEDFTRFPHDLNFGQTQDPSLKAYRKDLLDAVAAAAQVGVPEPDIVTASVFTTESATAVMEKISDQIHAETPDANNGYLTADFNLPTSPGGPSTTTPTVFSLNTTDPNGHVSGITVAQQTGWVQQNGIDQLNPVDATYTETINGVKQTFIGYGNAPGSSVVEGGLWSLDSQLNSLLNGAVSEIAFGKFVSPDYEVHPTPEQRAQGMPGEYIPTVGVGTLTGTPEVQGYNDIYFDLFLPSGTMPEGGWPVAIYGHGNNDLKEDSFRIAETLAEKGIATIAINAVGHGFGPDSYLTINQVDQTGAPLSPVTFLAGGRGIDQNNHGTIGSNEGVDASGSESVLVRSDGIRQTAADLMQLVRVIQGPNDLGMNVPSPGSGSSQLDPKHIYYVGQSLGANYGTVFLAVEPDVHAGVLSAPGNPLANEEWAGRAALGTQLQSRTSLANSPGITSIDGLAVGTPYFDENMPLRNGVPLTLGLVLPDGTKLPPVTIQSPMYNTLDGTKDGAPVPDAMAIQEALDNLTWASQVGNVVAYASHLRKDPLAGVPAKSVIIQMNKGDESAPNPNATAIVCAGGLADRVSYYRHDLAYAADPNIPKNPHQLLLGLPIAPKSTLEPVVEMAKQQQIAEFFASDGQFDFSDPLINLSNVTVSLNGQTQPLFEVGLTEDELPEGLNFIV